MKPLFLGKMFRQVYEACMLDYILHLLLSEASAVDSIKCVLSVCVCINSSVLSHLNHRFLSVCPSVSD